MITAARSFHRLDHRHHCCRNVRTSWEERRLFRGDEERSDPLHGPSPIYLSPTLVNNNAEYTLKNGDRNRESFLANILLRKAQRVLCFDTEGITRADNRLSCPRRARGRTLLWDETI